MKQSKWGILLRGILKENPVLVLVLGTCPTLATTRFIVNALGMGVATMAVLICSNVAISLLRNVIPDKVRIPAYIVLIAGFVTIVQLLMQAFVQSLYEALGVYLSLIVVNCIILGRAEMFASKNKPGDAALDGVGMGLGFICALLAMSLIREVFGAGSFCGIEIPFLANYKIGILQQAPGGFFVFGSLIAIVAKCTKGKAPRRHSFSCEGCPSAAVCTGHTCTAQATPDKEVKPS